MSFVTETPKILFNIFIFILIQTLFFYFISAEFVNRIIHEKVSRISGIFFKQLNTTQREVVYNYLEKQQIDDAPKVVSEKNTRDAKNCEFLLLRMGIPALLTFILFNTSLFVVGLKMFTSNISAYIFMICAYITEIGVFAILMNRYEYIGTLEILNIINNP